MKSDSNEIPKKTNKEISTSKEVFNLVNNFLDFTEIDPELKKVLSYIKSMAEWDFENFPAYDQEFELDKSIQVLSQPDFLRLCEISRVIAGHGLHPWYYCELDAVYNTTHQLSAAVHRESIRRLKAKG